MEQLLRRRAAAGEEARQRAEAAATLRRIILREVSCQVGSCWCWWCWCWWRWPPWGGSSWGRPSVRWAVWGDTIAVTDIFFQRNDNKGEPIERLATFKHITLHVWQQILVDAWCKDYRWCSPFSKSNVKSRTIPEIQISKNLAINLLFHFFLSYFGVSSDLSTAGCEDGRSNKITDSKMQKNFCNGSIIPQLGAQQTVCTTVQLSFKQ